MISMIFNSRYTKNSYYTAEVRHDMYGWWCLCLILIFCL
jgi:hypothetical protein